MFPENFYAVATFAVAPIEIPRNNLPTVRSRQPVSRVLRAEYVFYYLSH